MTDTPPTETRRERADREFATATSTLAELEQVWEDEEHRNRQRMIDYTVARERYLSAIRDARKDVAETRRVRRGLMTNAEKAVEDGRA